MRSTTRRAARWKASALVVLTGLALGACGGAKTALTSTTTTTTRSSVTTTTGGVTPTTAPTVVEQTLFFTRGTSLGVAHRAVTSASDPRFLTMEALLAGPNSSESAAGLTTAQSPGTVLRGITVAAGVAVVSLSQQFALPGPADVLSARLAQVVYTITEFPNVSKVEIEIGKIQLLSFAGVDLASPVGSGAGHRGVAPGPPGESGRRRHLARVAGRVRHHLGVRHLRTEPGGLPGEGPGGGHQHGRGRGDVHPDDSVHGDLVADGNHQSLRQTDLGNGAFPDGQFPPGHRAPDEHVTRPFGRTGGRSGRPQGADCGAQATER